MAIAPGTSHPTFGGGARKGAARPVLGGARVALEAMTDGAADRLWALSDAEVGDALGVLAEVHAAVAAQLVAVLAEAKGRSLGSGQGWGAVDWARAMAPSLPTKDLLDAHVVATAVLDGVRPELGDHRLGEVADAVAAAASGDAQERAGALPVSKAAQLCRFHRGIRGLAEPAWLAGATADLVDAARGRWGWDERTLAVAVRRTTDVARSDGTVERDAQVRRDHRSLVKSRGPVGMSRYTLLLDEEGAAVVDAAVDALAKPRRDEDTGELDPRTPAARRADALLDLVARAVSAPSGVPRQAKTSLVVTVPLDVLQGRCRGAGMTLDGEALTVGAVRRMACDAQVIPVVLGARGEVLDQGMGRRLFDRAQVRHLWLRDGQCTFPGCSKPAAWTDAHHLVHWADGGPTDIDNAALLCRAHHTVVHTNRYGGRVRLEHGSPRVEWDLTVGSYDTTLDEWRQRTRQRARTRPRPHPATT
ncbi:HNH endonuclease signature motif containing protein [Phycicoccus sp. Root101]|uniref:HNH endonuclease signature motif containing protein n=1 Tax=Phycicoccus sp. Root101 TaxID=1736421 RepID=UPI0012F8826A|nr:HNH endonuclease signature motif containing protein [Phycicoccus sp. Root101]